VIYCEVNFGAIYGRTAKGLLLNLEKYRFVSVIDNKKTGCDAGTVQGNGLNGVLICRDLDLAPPSGMLSIAERGVVLELVGF
jgi:uncharacterized NAD-dependent epimerase/dehydratase family protein